MASADNSFAVSLSGRDFVVRRPRMGVSETAPGLAVGASGVSLAAAACVELEGATALIDGRTFFPFVLDCFVISKRNRAANHG